MHRLSMNEITTFRWSLKEDLDHYHAAGYESIGVWLQKLSDYGEEEAIDLLAESQLRVSCTVWAGGFTGSDGRSLKEGVADTVRALRQSAAIEAGCLVLYSGGRNNHTFRHAQRLLATALDELITVAELVEVPIAIEPMHPASARDWTFLTDLATTLDIVEGFDSPYLKLALDTYHFSWDSALERLLPRLVPHLAIVHLGDRTALPSTDLERCLLGRGRIPLNRTVAALIEAGYDGDFDVKLIGPEIQQGDYPAVLRDSRMRAEQLVGVYQRS